MSLENVGSWLATCLSVVPSIIISESLPPLASTPHVPSQNLFQGIFTSSSCQLSRVLLSSPSDTFGIPSLESLISACILPFLALVPSPTMVLVPGHFGVLWLPLAHLTLLTGCGCHRESLAVILPTSDFLTLNWPWSLPAILGGAIQFFCVFSQLSSTGENQIPKWLCPLHIHRSCLSQTLTSAFQCVSPLAHPFPVSSTACFRLTVTPAS